MDFLQIFLVVAMLIVLFVLYKTHSRINKLSEQIPDTQTIDTLAERIQSTDESNRKSFERLAGTMGELSKATEQMMDVGRTITNLEDLLKPPRLRGGIGETMLEQLLAQVLPRNYYDLQYSFKIGGMVDAIIVLGDRIVPVDSKFPIDQFRRLIETEDETENRKERRAFIRSVKKRIDEIADKYILPDEGTYDFALMYIPAENIYYETIIKDKSGDELFPYSVERRVIPVSPNSFYAYLQVIIHGLKGMHIEEKAREIMDHLGRLQIDQEKFHKDFDVLGKHLKNARNKYENAERQLNIFEDKLLAVGGERENTELPPGEKST